MQTYDVIMLLVLAGAMIFGAWKGMAWQLASLASLLLSYVLALQFSPGLAPYFGSQSPWNRFLAMLVVYIATSLVIWLLFQIVVAQFINRLKLKEFDRQLGALLGLAKGVLLCVAITLFAVSLLPNPQRQAIMDSRSGFYIATLLDRAHAVMPEEIHEVVHPYLHRAQEGLEAAAKPSREPLDGPPPAVGRRAPRQPADGPPATVLGRVHAALPAEVHDTVHPYLQAIEAATGPPPADRP